MLNFPVDDIELAVDEPAAKGIAMEHYDLPDLKTDERGIFRGPTGPHAIAWFKDPAEHVLAVIGDIERGASTTRTRPVRKGRYRAEPCASSSPAAKCSTPGRLTAFLPESTRLLILKSDGSVLVHADAGGYAAELDDAADHGRGGG